ncbi:MAG: hypothetical protein C0614_11895 [Desulfuromonas sp.]|nr:MAG: hypothetical protein C0614_11895 [Desulfuromonas sp.]
MRIAIIIVLLLTIAGCGWLSDEFEAITLDELNRLKCEWQDTKVSKWFYLGSEEGYHKFVHRDLPGDKLYEIKSSEFTIDNPMPFSSNKTNWVTMPWGPTYAECKQ